MVAVFAYFFCCKMFPVVSLYVAFPLLFIKRYPKSSQLDKDGPDTVPEADSDYEEITSAEKQPVCYD